MNKVAVVLGVAAVATLVGCKDPEYGYRRSSESEVKSAGGEDLVTEANSCTCPKGTTHSEPCACGSADCTCTVVKSETAGAEQAASANAAPVEPEYTIYIVQRGDYLSKISKKFNITIASIKRLNSLTSDMIRVGQKLKLPGKVEVGEQKEPVQASARRATPGATVYEGPTQDYVVKSGDTLGAIAYGNGINIRQLKSLNALKSDTIRVGQMLKIPAGKSAVAPAVSVEEKKVAPAEAAVTEAPAEAKTVEAAAPAPVAPAVETQPTAAIDPAELTTYIVQEGEDVTAIAMAFGISAARVREINSLGENDQLKPGQVIKIPADQL